MGGTSRTLSYQHDAQGNRTRVQHPDGTYFTYSFDGLSRVDGLTETPASGGVSTLLTVDYRPSGDRLSITRPGGATTGVGLDNALRMRSFTQDFTATANDLTNTFDYNPASQVTQLTQSNSQYTYAQTQTKVGIYAPNGLNQYSSIAGQAIAYDNNGNLTGDGSLTYVYDMENRLVATSGAAASSFTYDPLGRLFQVTIDGTTTQFLYDGDALVAEYSGGVLTRRYVHGDQTDEPWVQYNGTTVGASTRRYLHADHQGSIIAHSSSAGAVINKLAYDAYGIPATANVDRFGYTGQAWLKELGLYHYKARMYAPKIGRFLQTDPVGYEDDFNLYAYVGNDPLNSTDPTGKDCMDLSTGPCETVTVTASKPAPTLDASTIVIPMPAPVSLPFWRANAVTAAAAILGNMLFSESCGDSGAIGPCAKGSNTMSANDKGGKPSDKSRRSKPARGVPPGTRPIDQSGKPHEWIEGTKGDVGAGPADWVGVAPNGDIVTTNPDGSAEIHGPSTR